jgi:hypothetical protein
VFDIGLGPEAKYDSGPMNASSAAAPRHQSTLATSRERFLASVLHFALSEGWRTPEDFLRHFGPRTLINALAGDDALRVRLLVATTRRRLPPRRTCRWRSTKG